MPVSLRAWTTSNGEPRQAWVARYCDGDGRRRLRTFPTEPLAKTFMAAVKAGNINTALASPDHGRSIVTLTSPLPRSKKRSGRQAVLDSLIAAYPRIKPTALPVIVHMVAECAPSSTVCDVDNLIKPVLDALAGHVYVNDTQVIECLARKIPSTRNAIKN